MKVPTNKNLFEYLWDAGLDTLVVCELEFEKGETGSLEAGIKIEPDIPDCVTFIKATVDGRNITKLLGEKTVECIEVLALSTLLT